MRLKGSTSGYNPNMSTLSKPTPEDARKKNVRLLSGRKRSRLYRQFKRWQQNSTIACKMSVQELKNIRQQMKIQIANNLELNRFQIENQMVGMTISLLIK